MENKQLIIVEPVTGTPFSTVQTEQGTFLALGRFRLTEPTHLVSLGEGEEADSVEREEWAFEVLEKDKWEIMLRVMSIIMDHRDAVSGKKEEVTNEE